MRRDRESRQTAQARQPASGTPAGLLRRVLPLPSCAGSLVLLVLVFAVSCAVGPVAPGTHGPGITQDGHEGGGTDVEDDDMGGMNHGSGN